MVVQPLLWKYLFHRTFACQAVFSPCVCGWPWLRKHLRTCHCWQHGCPWGQLLYPVKSQCHRFQLCLYSFLTVTKSFLVWGRAWGHVQWCLTESEDYNWGGHQQWPRAHWNLPRASKYGMMSLLALLKPSKPSELHSRPITLGVEQCDPRIAAMISVPALSNRGIGRLSRASAIILLCKKLRFPVFKELI